MSDAELREALDRLTSGAPDVSTLDLPALTATVRDRR